MANRFTPTATGLAPATSNGDAGALGIAVVGYGYWGPNLARNVIERSELELRALCERDASRGEAFSARYPGVPVESRLRATSSPTPTSTRSSSRRRRRPTTRSCARAEAGKHVLVEKPLATTYAHAARTGRRWRPSAGSC